MCNAETCVWRRCDAVCSLKFTRHAKLSQFTHGKFYHPPTEFVDKTAAALFTLKLTDKCHVGCVITVLPESWPSLYPISTPYLPPYLDYLRSDWSDHQRSKELSKQPRISPLLSKLSAKVVNERLKINRIFVRFPWVFPGCFLIDNREWSNSKPETLF
jgi:hypothetical protein